jgi:hypothetical protein
MHRAMDDVRESVRELQYYREKFFVSELPSSNGPATPSNPAS